MKIEHKFDQSFIFLYHNPELFMRFTFLLAIILIASCKTDSENNQTVMPENLQGTWQVISAKRNNRNALSLVNSEFYISKDKFSTNFLPDTTPYAYSYDGKQLKVMDPANSSFRVTKKTKDTLIFNTIIKNFDFSFTAVAKKEINDE